MSEIKKLLVLLKNTLKVSDDQLNTDKERLTDQSQWKKYRMKRCYMHIYTGQKLCPSHVKADMYLERRIRKRL